MHIPEHSLLVQASTLPSASKLFPSLNHFILSNAALEVSILLKTYLSTLGVKAEVICGLYKGPRGNAFPQVFLDIDGHIIENSFTHLEESWTPHRNMEVFVERFSQRKLLSNFVRESPSESKLAVIGKELLGEKFSQDDIDYLEVVCRTDLNQKKHIAMAISKSADNPGVCVYDLLMRSYLSSCLGADHPDLTAVEEEMMSKCWSCGRAGEELKTCTGCKAGKYCHKRCLGEEWVGMHKLMHKVWKKKGN